MVPQCFVVPPGFIPPGLAKKCGLDGNDEETHPIEHPGGPRDGWEHQHKKKHWEFHFTNDISLALPEPIQVTDKSQLTSEEPYYKWKQTYAYGAGQERISMTYLPAYDHDNGWEPSPGVGGAGPNTTPKTLYYLTDALGSAIGLVDKSGRISASYHYDEFGIVSNQKKFDVNWPGPDNLFGYTGLGYDYFSDLTYARARYYNPEFGRFISKDTYKGGIWNPQSQNQYTYVHNNPLRYVDPSGHKVWLIHGTWANPEKKGENSWSDDFFEYVEDYFGETSEDPYWSGKNRKSARSQGANDIADKIYKWHNDNRKEDGSIEAIRLVGHSHGGNVAIMIANRLAELDPNMKVETLITIATPVREYKLETEVGQHIGPMSRNRTS